MTIENASAVRYSNEKVRVMADVLAQAYATAKSLVNEWNASGMGSLITNTSDVIVDGSSLDGRLVITGAQATSIITRAMEFISDYEDSGNAKLNTVLAVKVNGQARF